jgi:chemosensory pili system protein ChpA (sensor histidine kinase/response regulator)
MTESIFLRITIVISSLVLCLVIGQWQYHQYLAKQEAALRAEQQRVEAQALAAQQAEAAAQNLAIAHQEAEEQHQKLLAIAEKIMKDAEMKAAKERADEAERKAQAQREAEKQERVARHRKQELDVDEMDKLVHRIAMRSEADAEQQEQERWNAKIAAQRAYNYQRAVEAAAYNAEVLQAEAKQHPDDLRAVQAAVEARRFNEEVQRERQQPLNEAEKSELHEQHIRQLYRELPSENFLAQ